MSKEEITAIMMQNATGVGPMSQSRQPADISEPNPDNMEALRALAAVAPELLPENTTAENSFENAEKIRQLLLSGKLHHEVKAANVARRQATEGRGPAKFKPMNPMCDAAEQGDLATLTRLIGTGGDVNALGENGNSALAFACANGHADCTSLLISNGATVDLKSNLGNTPLHAACWADSPKCMRILIDGKADVNQRSNTNGATPMHVAVQSNRDEALLVLLARGGDRKMKCDGRTALQLAVTLGHKECEKVLRKFDADEQAKEKRIAEAQRVEAEKKANAAADLLLAELEAEEEAKSGGKAAGGKKASKKQRQKAERAAAQAAQAAQAAGKTAGEDDLQALDVLSTRTADLLDEGKAKSAVFRAKVETSLQGGGGGGGGGGSGEAKDGGDAPLDEDAAMAAALVGGGKARRRGGRRGGGASAGVSVASLVLGGVDPTDEDGLSAGLGDAEDGEAAEDAALNIRRAVMRCPYCGSRARPTPKGRCPSCFADLPGSPGNPTPASDGKPFVLGAPSLK